MNRNGARTLAVVSAAIAAVTAGPMAYADPPDPVAPQPGDPCGMAYGSAQTVSAQQEPLACKDSQWQKIDGFQRPVHTFYTYGPAATLTADDVIAGEYWVGIPVKVEGICSEQQTLSTGESLPARSNNVGQYFDFGLKEGLVSLKLSGYCNWEMVRALGAPPPRA